MAMDEAGLQAAARRSYEAGRVRAAVVSAMPAFPMAAASLLGCGRPAASVAIGSILFSCVVVLRWRGGARGRGAMAGMVAGIAPLLIPIVARAVHVCSGGTCYVPISACLVGGVAAGALVGAVAARRADGRTMFLISASLVACLAGMMGCLVAGLGGVLGLAGGMAFAGFPAFAVSRMVSRA